jgi:hypothetical protein
MKALFVEYARYNTRCNELLGELIHLFEVRNASGQDSPEMSEVRSIVVQMWDDSAVWWQRLKLQEAITHPGRGYTGSAGDAFNALKVQDALWESWVIHAQPLALEHVFQYYDSKRHCHKLPVYRMLLHLFNAATQCRGKLLQLLQQGRMNDMPSFDMIQFNKQKKVAY